MAKTKIDWCDYTINCFWGCLNGCTYCQARNMARRFGRRIGESRMYTPETVERMRNFQPVWLPDQLTLLQRAKKPSRFFISFMGEPFGEWNHPSWLEKVFDYAKAYPQHTVIMLTKQPWNLVKWSPFPDNVWVGVSVDGTNNAPLVRMLYTGFNRVKARVKFISFEPLLDYPTPLDPGDLVACGVSWVIVGQQTPTRGKTRPKVGWVTEVIEAGDKAGTAVFLKNNLRPLFSTLFQPWAFGWIDHEEPAYSRLRQEFPK